MYAIRSYYGIIMYGYVLLCTVMYTYVHLCTLMYTYVHLCTLRYTWQAHFHPPLLGPWKGPALPPFPPPTHFLQQALGKPLVFSSTEWLAGCLVGRLPGWTDWLAGWLAFLAGLTNWLVGLATSMHTCKFLGWPFWLADWLAGLTGWLVGLPTLIDT